MLAYALYAATSRTWVTYDGQQINFDRLAERVMREPLARGVCAGNHRLHTLVMLLRVDEQETILSAEARGQIIAHLQDATRRLIDHQHRDGYWNRKWPDGPATDVRTDTADGAPIAHRILATGHALEWWALAPPEVQPPREAVVRAGQWLVRTIEDLDEKKTSDYYTFLTHAGRALALWRGGFPAELFVQQPSNRQRSGSDDSAKL